jgi:DNA-binding Lrp family transcriptional regulator
MTDLAARVLISRSGLTRLVDRMERAGMVERVSCPSDARGHVRRADRRRLPTTQEYGGDAPARGARARHRQFEGQELDRLFELMSRLAGPSRPSGPDGDGTGTGSRG